MLGAGAKIGEARGGERGAQQAVDVGCRRLAAIVDGSDEMDRQQKIETDLDIWFDFTCGTDLAERWCSIHTRLKQEDE